MQIAHLVDGDVIMQHAAEVLSSRMARFDKLRYSHACGRSGDGIDGSGVHEPCPPQEAGPRQTRQRTEPDQPGADAGFRKLHPDLCEEIVRCRLAALRRELPDASFTDVLAALPLAMHRTALHLEALSGRVIHVDLRHSLGEHTVEVLADCNADASVRITGMHAPRYALAHLTCLTALDVSGNGLVGADAAVLAPMLRALTRLVALDISGNSFGTDGASVLAPALRNLVHLTSLRSESAALTKWGVSALSALTQLRALNVADNSLERPGATALSRALSALTRLTALNVGSNDFCNASVRALAPALRALTALAELNVADIGLGQSGAAELAPALRCLTSLTSLDLGNNWLDTPSAVAALEPALRELTRLVELRLWSNALGARGVTALQPALCALTGLTALDLRVSGLTVPRAVCRALEPVLCALTGLKMLKLSGNVLLKEDLQPMLSTLPRLNAEF
jgi:Leucine Rich repeat